jgi:hypothetical protein
MGPGGGIRRAASVTGQITTAPQRVVSPPNGAEMIHARSTLLRWLLASTAVATGSAFTLGAANPLGQPAVGSGVGHAGGGPVLVELFTSEGCSSCPSADDLLMTLEKTHQEVIVLSEHVDYWNRLGWADPFSSARFSERQRSYASRFGNASVYTPQMVIDGRREMVGSDRVRVLGAIADAASQPTATVTLVPGVQHRVEGSNAVPVEVAIGHLPMVRTGETVDVIMAVTEGPLHSQVSQGENRGRTLNHAAVARRFIELGRLDAGQRTFSSRMEVSLEPSWNPAKLKVVVFVQERGSGHVLGAASARLLWAPGSH